jgi:hypothetical protein
MNGEAFMTPYTGTAISLRELPLPEQEAFGLTGGNGSQMQQIGDQLQSLEETIEYNSPGGICVWSGSIAQGSREIPFTGRQNTRAGANKIVALMTGDAVRWMKARGPYVVRLKELNCDGRPLRPVDGERYLVELSMDSVVP